jgi:hypothetical protein
VESAVDTCANSPTSLEQLGTGFEAFHQRAVDSFREADGKLTRHHRLRRLASSLETDAGDSVTALEGDGTEFASEMTALGGELDGLYGGWDGNIDDTAADLISS